MWYARLVQAARNARGAQEREDRDGWRRAAFVGWQSHLRPRRHLSFEEWLGQFGLAEKRRGPTAAVAAVEVARARANAADVLRAFGAEV